MTAELRQRYRNLALLIFALIAINAVNNILLVNVLDISNDYFDPRQGGSINESRTPMPYAERPLMGLLIFFSLVGIAGVLAVVFYEASVLFLPNDYFLTRQLINVLILGAFVSALFQSFAATYVLVYAENMALWQMGIHLQNIAFFAYQLHASLYIEVIGVALFYARTLPRALTIVAIITGITGLTLNILTMNPDFFPQGRLSLLPVVNSLFGILLAIYLMIVTSREARPIS